MVGREANGIWITLKEEVHAAPAEVASCIASSAGFCRWLAVGCDLREPDAADGRDGRSAPTLTIAWDRAWDHTTEVRILEHDTDALADGRARIRFEWFPSPIDDTPVPIEISVAPLAERGDGTGGARVILRQGPFADESDNLLFMADSAESWRWYLCNLRSVLEAKHDMRAVRPL
ncbi:MAG: hypothetical protein LW806_06285 [Planctomycetaceae bacterium]|jgi:hypothetical protein|nr:hypothetical protein [Planctomycetaceae bacterium]